MKYIRIVAIAIFFHIVLNLFMPWWNVVIAGLIAGYFSKLPPVKTFLLVFLALFAYWLVLILQIDNINEHILSARVAEMLSLPNSTMLIILNCFIGGICGGLGSLIGLFLKSIIKNTNKVN